MFRLPLTLHKLDNSCRDTPSGIHSYSQCRWGSTGHLRSRSHQPPTEVKIAFIDLAGFAESHGLDQEQIKAQQGACAIEPFIIIAFSPLSGVVCWLEGQHNKDVGDVASSLCSSECHWPCLTGEKRGAREQLVLAQNASLSQMLDALNASHRRKAHHKVRATLKYINTHLLSSFYFPPHFFLHSRSSLSWLLFL